MCLSFTYVIIVIIQLVLVFDTQTLCHGTPMPISEMAYDPTITYNTGVLKSTLPPHTQGIDLCDFPHTYKIENNCPLLWNAMDAANRCARRIGTSWIAMGGITMMAARFGTGYFPVELGARPESIGDQKMLDIGAGSNDHGHDADIDGYLFVKTLSEWQRFTRCLGEEMDPKAQYHPSSDPSSDAGGRGFTKYSYTSQSYPQPVNGSNCPFIHMLNFAPVIKQDGCLRVLEEEKIIKEGENACLPEDVVFPIRNVSLWGHALPVSREFWRHNLNAADNEYGNTCKDVALPSFLYSAASIPKRQLDNVIQACKHKLAEGGFVTIDSYEKCNDNPIIFRPMQPCTPTSDGDVACGGVIPPPRLPLTTTAQRDGGKGGGTEGPTSRVKTTHKLMVQPGAGVIIEIGLHNKMLSPIGPNSFVLGVEASLDSIIENMGPYRKVPQTSILNAAVFDRDGLSVFQEMDGWTPASTLVVDVGLEKSEGRKFAITRQTPVATIKLGHLIDSIPEHSRLDLLKVDVQGVNYNVLAGAGDKIKRARSVFTECTRDGIKQNGFTSVELYGNEDDLCLNIRSYMETMGFVYIGHWVEGFGDASGDIAFVAKQYVDLVRPCFADEIGNITTIKDEDIPMCMAKAMAGAVAH